MLAILTTHPIQYQIPLWQALARDGRVPFEVWYLTDHGTRPSRDREFERTFAWDLDMLSGYPYRFLRAADGATPSSFWKCRLGERLQKRLKTSNTTALWIQGWQVAAYWQAVWEARSAGVEVWLRGESNTLARQSFRRSVVREARLRWLFRRVCKFFYIGTANRRLYQEFGVSSEQLYPAPYAVDNERFARQAATLLPQRNLLRQRWGIPDDAFCVLFCGKFIPKKRPLDLVDAARILLRNGSLPGLHLLFAGSGVLGPELRGACRVMFDAAAPEQRPAPQPCDLSLPPASFTGFLNQTEISQAYVVADALVLPSDFGETWGLVVNEALASGLPCLVSAACGCAEDLCAEATFGLGDVSTLASKILDMSQHVCERVGPPAISESVASIVRAYGESQAPVDPAIEAPSASSVNVIS